MTKGYIRNIMLKKATKCNNMDNAIQCISIDKNARDSDAFQFIQISFINFPVFFK